MPKEKERGTWKSDAVRGTVVGTRKGEWQTRPKK